MPPVPMRWRSGHTTTSVELEGLQMGVVSAVTDDKATGMAKKLKTKDRKKLSKKSFALPGKRKYPIPDKAHARNALARVAQNGTPAEQKKVRAAVKRRFPSIGKKKTKKA
jgi:hypothetical protein